MWLLPRVCDARVAFLGRHYRGARCRAAGRLCRAFLFFPAAQDGTKLHQMALCPLSFVWTSSAPGLLTSPAGCADLGVAQPNAVPSASGAHRRSIEELCSPLLQSHCSQRIAGCCLTAPSPFSTPGASKATSRNPPPALCIPTAGTQAGGWLWCSGTLLVSAGEVCPQEELHLGRGWVMNHSCDGALPFPPCELQGRSYHSLQEAISELWGNAGASSLAIANRKIQDT